MNIRPLPVIFGIGLLVVLAVGVSVAMASTCTNQSCNGHTLTCTCPEGQQCGIDCSMVIPHCVCNCAGS